MYSNGQGVKQDYTEAMKWYQKAVDQGNMVAQRNIGVMYENGWGVNQDYNEALKWYLKAAEPRGRRCSDQPRKYVPIW
jgi:TPR repeat protein